MNLSEILRAGKQRIEQHGWCQGDQEAIFGTSGKCCAATAIRDDKFSNRSAALRLFEKVNGIGGPISGGIAIWNDAPERTLPEVLAAYDKAIAAAEAQEQANVRPA